MPRFSRIPHFSVAFPAAFLHFFSVSNLRVKIPPKFRYFGNALMLLQKFADGESGLLFHLKQALWPFCEGTPGRRFGLRLSQRERSRITGPFK
jgi:hypothetical protein